jgi:hypothetical protein
MEKAMRKSVQATFQIPLLWLLIATCAVGVSARQAAGQAEEPKEISVEPFDSKTTGAVQVTGQTRDLFEVQKDGKKAYAGAPPLLNKMVELTPGEYEIEVNKTTRTVKVEVGKTIVVHTGTLVVEGKKANFYAPYQGRERKVTANPRKLNTPMALLPGTYRVELNVEVNKQVVLADGVKITADKKTTLQE